MMPLDKESGEQQGDRLSLGLVGMERKFPVYEQEGEDDDADSGD